MKELTTEEAESVADEYIEEIEDVGYPDEWRIDKLAEPTCDESNHWLLFEIQVGEHDAHIELYCRPEDRRACIWVWLDGEMRQTSWGRGGEEIPEMGKQYLEELRSDG